MTRNRDPVVSVLIVLITSVVVCLPPCVGPVAAVDVLRVGAGGIDWEDIGELEGVSTENGVLRLSRVDRARDALADLRSRGGHIFAAQDKHASLIGPLTDGSRSTFWQPRATRTDFTGFSLRIDLGAILPIERIIVSGKEESFMRAWELFLHDGDPDSMRFDLPIDFGDPVLSNANEESPVIDITFPLQYVRFIKLENRAEKIFTVTELEVFGDGFAPSGQFTSQIRDLKEPANFGDMLASAVRDPQADVVLQTRTGSVPDPRIYYQKVEDVRAGGITEEPIEPVGFPQAAGIFSTLDSDDRVERDNLQEWSRWTAPSVDLTDQFRSPGNRQFLQFRLLFTSGHVRQTASVRSFQIEFSTPSLAGGGVMGEIVPATVVLGQEHTFDYFIRPDFAIQAPLLAVQVGVQGTNLRWNPFSGASFGAYRVERRRDDDGQFGEIARINDASKASYTDSDRESGVSYEYRILVEPGGVPGLDAIRITTPFPATLESVELDGETVPPDQFEEMGLDDPSSFTVWLKERRIQSSDQVLKVRFRGLVTVFGTRFSGRVFDFGRGEFGQEVLPGDATADSDANRLSIHGELLRTLLKDLQVEPAVFTPNGDGINDELTITYVLMKALAAVPVELTLHDLTGRRVRQLQADQPNGPASTSLDSWDGRDDGERLVPPGLYLLRLSVSTDTGSETQTRLVHLAY